MAQYGGVLWRRGEALWGPIYWHNMGGHYGEEGKEHYGGIYWGPYILTRIIGGHYGEVGDKSTMRALYRGI